MVLLLLLQAKDGGLGFILLNTTLKFSVLNIHVQYDVGVKGTSLNFYGCPN